MSVEGTKREKVEGEFGKKKVGLFIAKVIAINPDDNEYKEVLGWEPKEGTTNYLGEDKEGNTRLRIDVWIKNIKNDDKSKIVFFLRDKEVYYEKSKKTQYINNIGNCYAVIGPDSLPDYFKAYSYRKSYSGESELYNFVKKWLGNLDVNKEGGELTFEWKKLMKGNTRELKELVGSEWTTDIGVMSIIEVSTKDGLEYANIYNRDFFPGYALPYFNNVDYKENDHLAKELRERNNAIKIGNKQLQKLKPFEKFIVSVTDPEFGCRDFYILKELREYNPEENLVASNKVISESGSDY